MPGPGQDAYPPIADYALIGDCHSAALVSRQGSIEWCCLPRSDSGSTFAAILDRERGGVCSISPVGNGPWGYSREEDPDHELAARVQIGTGERIRLSLGYHPPELIDAGEVEEPDAHTLDGHLQQTIRWWRRFAKTVELDSSDLPSARRSAIAPKALTHAPTGAIVAAPTTSLPEVIGGARNWDYRYAWVRDSSFSSRAFAAVGCIDEADAFAPAASEGA